MEDLILENKNLIYDIAKNYSGVAEMDDLFQAGCIGIIKASKKYNRNLHTKFSTFAYFYIKGEMNDLVNKNRNMKVSSDMIYLNLKIEKTKNYLMLELGRIPTDEEIIAYLGIDNYAYNQAINISSVTSLDETLDDTSLYDIIGNNMDIDSIIDLENELSKLNDTDKKILLYQYMYGLTQTEISKRMGINQVQVSRRKEKALTMINSHLK